MKKTTQVALISAFAISCANATIAPNTPIYYTENGTGGNYQEIGPVIGSSFGYCLSDEGVYNAAILDALDKAKKLGGNAILIPNSMSGTGIKTSSSCTFSCQIFLFPGGSGKVQALAIKVNSLTLNQSDDLKQMIREGKIIMSQNF